MKMANISNISEPVIHKSKWIMIDPDTVLESGYIQVESGVIKEIGSGRRCGSGIVYDHGSGIIMPKLINAHTHLELCALKGKLTYDKGFRDWVKQLIAQREKETKDSLLAASKQGIQELLSTGCGVVGDISSMRLTWKVLSESPLAGVWFQEYLGNLDNQSIYEVTDINRIRKSFSGHAPHTTDPDLLRYLKQETRKIGLPFSIHVSESEDEIEFITTGKGKWAEFLTQRGIRFSSWDIPARSPIQYLNKLGILDHRTLVVHAVFADRTDFEILNQHQTPVCICVRSNLNLHGALPNILEMLDCGITPCLGTDSLASVDSLSILDEIASISRWFSSIPPEKIIEMAVISGAKALGFDNYYGTLAPGKFGDLLYLDIEASSTHDVLEKIVNFSDIQSENRVI